MTRRKKKHHVWQIPRTPSPSTSPRVSEDGLCDLLRVKVDFRSLSGELLGLHMYVVKDLDTEPSLRDILLRARKFVFQRHGSSLRVQDVIFEVAGETKGASPMSCKTNKDLALREAVAGPQSNGCVFHGSCLEYFVLAQVVVELPPLQPRARSS